MPGSMYAANAGGGFFVPNQRAAAFMPGTAQMPGAQIRATTPRWPVQGFQAAPRGLIQCQC